MVMKFVYAIPKSPLPRGLKNNLEGAIDEFLAEGFRPSLAQLTEIVNEIFYQEEDCGVHRAHMNHHMLDYLGMI